MGRDNQIATNAKFLDIMYKTYGFSADLWPRFPTAHLINIINPFKELKEAQHCLHKVSFIPMVVNKLTN